MSEVPLRREFEYFIAHQEELVAKYHGKVVVIEGEAVSGVYETVVEAVDETSKQHELGTFLVQRCEPGPECYTATFHGYRVSPAAAGG